MEPYILLKLTPYSMSFYNLTVNTDEIKVFYRTGVVNDKKKEVNYFLMCLN